jgi:hypothetical protein
MNVTDRNREPAIDPSQTPGTTARTAAMAAHHHGLAWFTQSYDLADPDGRDKLLAEFPDADVDPADTHVVYPLRLGNRTLLLRVQDVPLATLILAIERLGFEEATATFSYRPGMLA